MRKHLAAIMAFLTLMTAFLTGCGKPAETPAISYEGYEYTERLTGGAEVTDANVKSLTFSQSEGDLTVTFGFLSGSRLSGGASETAALEAPAYAVYMLKNPARLVVEFTNIAYWDYTRDTVLPESPLLFGFFHTRFTDDTSLRFTFQLNSDAAYKAEAVTGGLNISLRPIVKPASTDSGAAEDILQGSRYYAMANAYRDYCEGKLKRDVGVEPVLAQNGQDILMLSEAFYSEAEAKNFVTALAKNEGVVEAQWDVSVLGENEAPAYSEQQSYERAYTQNVVRINGTPAAAEVLIEDGLYLCHMPDKKAYLYSKRLAGGQPGVDEYTYEQVYYREVSGTSRPYLDYEFQVVEQAKFSPDGRKLAVLERDEERTHLYVFDVDTRELITDLTDMGFGELVSAFTWDGLGLSIYAVSGSGAMQVHAYDFGVPQEAKRHSVVDKNGADEGYIAYSDGELYFTQSNLEKGEIVYRIKPDGGVRKALTSGGAFALSPDNRFMALNVSGTSLVSQGTASGFSLYNMETGETELLTSEVSVSNFIWSPSGARLYYIENKLAGSGGENATSEEEQAATTDESADPYPYTLWVYDVATKQSSSLMDLPYPWIVASDGEDAIYLNFYDAETGGDLVRATYTIPVG
jgi:dipeptidyl aminopeptidase/acylaminoacyl peptidase